ncbi:MAG TPA: hypothetical protein VHS52_02170 [Acidimicrobiales bacterium]|nr:hypothetical protein [Acidimicrobiales bacterium]
MRRSGPRRSLLALLPALAVGLGAVGATSPAAAKKPAPPTATSTLLTHRVGFGAAVTGGAAAPVTKVTDCGDNPTAPAHGTLRAVLTGPGPHSVKWATSCTTHLLAELPVPSDTTLDGSGQAVTLTGMNDEHDGLVVDHVANVIIHDLTITEFGIPANRQINDMPNGILVTASHGVWVDHNTLSDIGNKQVTIQTGTTDVTVSWNRFVGDEYQAQFFQIGNQMEGPSLGSVQNVTSHHNLYTAVGYRTPAIAYGTLHQFNDVVEQWVSTGVHCQRQAQCYLENDVFVSSGASNGLVGVKYSPSGAGCNDAGTLCDSTWGAGTVVNPYLPVAGTVAASSVEQPPCATPPVAPCSPYYGSGPQTFTPTYTYAPETAGETLRARVEANAGSHAIPTW